LRPQASAGRRNEVIPTCDKDIYAGGVTRRSVKEVSDFKNNRAHEEWFSTIGLPNGFFTDFTDFTDLKYQKNIAEQVN
jgi:hypothetical protein